MKHITTKEVINDPMNVLENKINTLDQNLDSARKMLHKKKES